MNDCRDAAAKRPTSRTAAIVKPRMVMGCARMNLTRPAMLNSRKAFATRAAASDTALTAISLVQLSSSTHSRMGPAVPVWIWYEGRAALITSQHRGLTPIRAQGADAEGIRQRPNCAYVALTLCEPAEDDLVNVPAIKGHAVDANHRRLYEVSFHTGMFGRVYGMTWDQDKPFLLPLHQLCLQLRRQPDGSRL